MAEPKIVDTKPMVMTLEEGSHWWCACGESLDQPFCDGSHAGSGMLPVEFKLTEQRQVALCLCKHTGTPPFCDGSHTKL